MAPMPPGSEKQPQPADENDGIKAYYTNKIEDLQVWFCFIGFFEELMSLNFSAHSKWENAESSPSSSSTE